MHIVMFADQHLDSLGGAQVSMRLQKRFLEKSGHVVTVVAPAMRGPRTRAVASDPTFLDMPSMPITLDREYSLTWPGARTDRWVDAALASLPPADVVHVQADFWGAFIGHRYAARHSLPVVHTMHNRVDVGIAHTAPFPSLVLRAVNAWQRRTLGVFVESTSPGSDGWSFLQRFASLSDAVTAPSAHFAARLEEHGVVPGHPAFLRRSAEARHALSDGVAPAPAEVDVIWNGIDDEVLDQVLEAAASEGAHAPSNRKPGPARFVWLGRMSPEKRLLPFLEALALSGVVADVEIIGGGGQLAAARRLVEKRRPVASVTFAGRLPYVDTLRRIAAADAVVQTSIGFETQGMTIFEAASLGTPAVVSDPDLAGELGSGLWAVADESVAALAGTLQRAASDITEGTAPAVDPAVREAFRQSSRTAAMLAVYRRVTA